MEAVDPTVREMAEAWAALESAGRCKPVSPHWRRTRAGLLVHLLAAIGDVPASQLRPRHVFEIQAYGAAQGLSAETTNKISHNVLGGMLTALELDEQLPFGARDRVLRRVPKLRRERASSGRALTDEERDRVLKAFRGHWAGPLVHFLLLTGVRIGEACGLRQGDIDWGRRVCRIQRSRRGNEISATKSLNSQRTFILPHAAVAAIAPLRRDDPNAFLFLGKRGYPINADSFRNRTWGPKIKRIGLEGFRIHDCRHTLATALFEDGEAPARIAKLLGNSVSVAERLYNHVEIGDRVAARVATPGLKAVR